MFFQKKRKLNNQTNEVELTDIFSLAKSILPKGSPGVIFDVGAHYGKITLGLTKDNPKLSIFAFEPGSYAFEILRRNTDNKDNVNIYDFAFGNERGRNFLNINHFNETNSLLLSNKVTPAIYNLTQTLSQEDVWVETIDSFSLINNIKCIDLLKIDAQGFTFEILMGATQMLKDRRIKHIYAEVEFVEIYKGEKLFSEIEILLRSENIRFMNLFNIKYIGNNEIGWADAYFRLI